MCYYENKIKDLAYKPDGKVIATAESNEVRLWDLSNGETLKRFPIEHEEGSYPIALTYSPDGKVITTRSWDNTVRLWDAEDGKHLKTLEGHNKRVSIFTYSPNGKVIASGSKTKQ